VGHGLVGTDRTREGGALLGVLERHVLGTLGDRHQLRRERVQLRAVWLVQPVVQTAGDQLQVAARQAEQQARGAGDVEDGISERDLLRQGRASIARGYPG